MLCDNGPLIEGSCLIHFFLCACMHAMRLPAKGFHSRFSEQGCLAKAHFMGLARSTLEPARLPGLCLLAVCVQAWTMSCGYSRPIRQVNFDALKGCMAWLDALVPKGAHLRTCATCAFHRLKERTFSHAWTASETSLFLHHGAANARLEATGQLILCLGCSLGVASERPFR